jgi:hypothetical protein
LFCDYQTLCSPNGFVTPLGRPSESAGYAKVPAGVIIDCRLPS